MRNLRTQGDFASQDNFIVTNGRIYTLIKRQKMSLEKHLQAHLSIQNQSLTFFLLTWGQILLFSIYKVV